MAISLFSRIETTLPPATNPTQSTSDSTTTATVTTAVERAPKSLTFLQESEAGHTNSILPIQSSSSKFMMSVESSTVSNDLKNENIWSAQIHSSSAIKSLQTSAELPISSTTISRQHLSILLGTLVPLVLGIVVLLILVIKFSFYQFYPVKHLNNVKLLAFNTPTISIQLGSDNWTPNIWKILISGHFCVWFLRQKLRDNLSNTSDYNI
jgi:hypothetical protein